ERLPYRIVGTIGEAGLVSPRELAYYAGATGLAAHIDGLSTARLTHYGRADAPPEQTDTALSLSVLVMIIVLLTPVAVFIAAAVRFGGERRDRRLAALRLVGSDSAMIRRIAAGESVAGSLLGLLVGGALFLAGRQLVGSVEIAGISVYPDYLAPSPVLTLVVVVGVPVASALTTVFALRNVAIEPLGVVRTAKPPRRRLVWRLLFPLVGLALLAPMIGQGTENGEINPYLAGSGVLLLLIGVTTLLPWIVERVVARLGAGAVSWQLAIRRLQLSSGTAARMVNGIAVGVAGAIALQMLFTGTETAYVKSTGKDVSRAQMEVLLPGDSALDSTVGRFATTKGVRKAIALTGTQASDQSWQSESSPEESVGTTVGDCASLREIARLPACRDGDVFVATGGDPYYDRIAAKLVRPGRLLHLDTPTDDGQGSPLTLTVPAGVKDVPVIESPFGDGTGGLLLTTGAAPDQLVARAGASLYVLLDGSVPDAREYVRNAVAAIGPWTTLNEWAESEVDWRYSAVRTGLSIGSICVLLLTGASLMLSQLEQLRERRRLFSALVAFGTRRRTLSLSVLWQTTVPVAFGMLLALISGLTLGYVLLAVLDTKATVDWWSVFTLVGVSAGVILAVTLLSLPPLLRMLRPDGLRTE
ncbi:ABC transporter permease, partial [Streptomyces sp. NPDC086091]|uniref:ABC transporter permease n=1 Tax=Streptomyces sp. NPDC086091 TaxID=3365751 RepID=UPI0038069105